MPLEVILWLAGLGVLLVGGLLVIIGYFLKDFKKGLREDISNVCQELKELKDAMLDLSERSVRNEEKGRAGFNILSGRIDEHNRRIGKIEDRLTPP